MYFAVKKTLKIGEKRYVPCVCYTLTNALKSTIEDLESKGIAYTSETYLVYESGKRIDVKKHAKAKVEAKVEAKVSNKEEKKAK